MIPVIEIGWKARDALACTGGTASVLAALSDSTYLDAGGEILWLGRPGATLHGRAVVGGPGVDDAPPTFDLSCARVWGPWPPSAASPSAARAAARALGGAIDALGEPRGLGALLAGRRPAAPLDVAAGAATALARACAADDADGAASAAEALVGLGPGLTPAGDDYVGGAFFARAVLGPRDEGAWPRAGARVVALARGRTHPVSAALLADLVVGEGWAPLHDLAEALASGAPLEAALDAARKLRRLGHSSGWDLLAGFMGAILGAPPPRNPGVQ